AREGLVRSGPQRVGQAVDLGAELRAGRAGLEMVLEQRSLEAGQLTVQFQRRPLARAVAFSVHQPHVTSDGGGVQKLADVCAEKDADKSRRTSAYRRAGPR